MSQLSLQTRTIIAAAFAEGEKLGLKPLTVAVLDAGGHLIALERADGASILRPQIAMGKAYGAVAIGAGSRWLNENAQTRPHFIQALNGVAGGTIVPVPGGVLIRNENGDILGAVGITGDTSENDEACAIKGIQSAGLTPDAG